MIAKKVLLPLFFISFYMSFFIPYALTQEEVNATAESQEFDFANGLFSRGMYDMAV